MKKILIIVLCAIILFVLTACTARYTKDRQETYFGFVLVRDVGDKLHVCYDPDTNICYIIIWNFMTYGYGISPYYIIENNEPVVAVYGKNYN